MTVSEASLARQATEVVADPTWFPVDLDRQQSDVIFAKTSYEVLSSLPFLSAKAWDTTGVELRRVHLGRVLSCYGENPPKPELNMIWHTAFCGSTLLCRTLDLRERNLTLREPVIFARLADLKREGYLYRDAKTTRVATVLLSLLARPLVPGAKIVIKPTNSANILARDIANSTSGKSLFLYSDCRSFVSALVRRGQEGMHYGRRVIWGTKNDGVSPLSEWSQEDLFDLSDLEVAAMGWHAQITEFNRTLSESNPERTASLDCDAFVYSPATAIAKIDDFFGLGLGFSHVEKTVRSPLLRVDAKKTSRKFGALQRRLEQQSLDWKMGREIDYIVAWSYEKSPGTPKDVPVPSPLISLNKQYRPTAATKS